MFKVGDIVTCSNNSGYKGSLTNGKDYIVFTSTIELGDEFISFKGDDKRTYIALASRFILASQAQQAPTYPNQINPTPVNSPVIFKRGDKVEYCDSNTCNGAMIRGKVYEVLAVNYASSPQVLQCWNNYGQAINYNVDRFKLVTATNPYSSAIYNWTPPPGINFGQRLVEPNGAVTFPNMTKTCMHEMIDYIGFTQRYKYCKKCDHKET